MDLVQDRGRQRALVSTVINFRIPYEIEKFLTAEYPAVSYD
jgi:hypothetical protein